MSKDSARAYGSGTIYIKHGAFYGRWITRDGGRANRRLGTARLPGKRDGLTRSQAEKRLRELIDEVRNVSNPERTVADAGQAFLEHLEVLGRSKSHRETVESHLRVHIGPALGRHPMDRLDEERVTHFAAKLRRDGKAPKTIRNILSTLHSVCDLAVKRRWCASNPCR